MLVICEKKERYTCKNSNEVEMIRIRTVREKKIAIQCSMVSSENHTHVTFIWIEYNLFNWNAEFHESGIVE
jgi:hypothetical protein